MSTLDDILMQKIQRRDIDGIKSMMGDLDIKNRVKSPTLDEGIDMMKNVEIGKYMRIMNLLHEKFEISMRGKEENTLALNEDLLIEKADKEDINTVKELLDDHRIGHKFPVIYVTSLLQERICTSQKIADLLQSIRDERTIILD